METQGLLDKLDEETRDNIAQALWMKKLNPEQIPDEIIKRLESEKNSNESFGNRMQYLLAEKLRNPDSYTPNYKRVYETLIKHSSSLSPHQAYAMTFFLGMDSSKGYKAIPRKADFTIPQDDAPQFDYQLGWHFIVGSCIGSNGKEYGVQFMFWQYALLPPDIAKHFGLSDLENQIIELHLAISEAGGKHYRSKPIIVAGTTGLIDFSDKPFNYTMGKNIIRSLSEDITFPMQIKGWGLDLDPDSPSEIEVDITLTQTKDYLLQGKNGCDPCCGGVGTLYYSLPNLRVDPENSTLRINNEKVSLKSGKFWYDHQWCNGMLPGGNPRVKVLRLANNMNKKPAGGWDWFMAQFKGDRELTMASIHSNEMTQFYEQTSGTLGRDFRITGSSSLSFDLAWTGNFSLILALYTPVLDRFDYSSSSYMIYLNPGYVTLQRIQGGAGAINLGQAQIPEMGTKSHLHLEVRANKADATVGLFADDHLVQRWKDSAGFVAHGPGVVFFAQLDGPSIHLSNIKVAQWEGDLNPLETSTNSAGAQDLVYLVNHDKVSGKVDQLEENSLSVTASDVHLKIPLSRVSQINLHAPESLPSPVSPWEVRVRFAGGGTLGFRFDGWNEGRITGSSPNFGPVELEPRYLRELQFGGVRTSDGLAGDNQDAEDWDLNE